MQANKWVRTKASSFLRYACPYAIAMLKSQRVARKERDFLRFCADYGGPSVPAYHLRDLRTGTCSAHQPEASDGWKVSEQKGAVRWDARPPCLWSSPRTSCASFTSPCSLS